MSPESQLIVLSTLLITRRYTLQVILKEFSHEIAMIQHTLSVTDCTTQRISLFSDGKSVLYWRQGVYHVVLSVHDHTPYALFSTSYTIGVLRPNQLELSCNGKVENGMAVDHKMLLATPLQLSLPSSVHPQSIRWIVDDTPLATTTPSLRLSQDVLDSTKEKHVVYAFVYTDDAGLPEFSTSWSFSFRSEETPTTRPPTKPTAQPTIPPRVAPTVPPKSEVETTYCGNGVCDGQETCESCPLDCGVCNSYVCSSTYCSLDSCQCASTHHPSLSERNEMPQFVAITWDDAQTPTTFEEVMRVTRESSVCFLLHCQLVDTRPLRMQTQVHLLYSNKRQSISVHKTTLSGGTRSGAAFRQS